jgi:hypothetical protein
MLKVFAIESTTFKYDLFMTLEFSPRMFSNLPKITNLNPLNPQNPNPYTSLCLNPKTKIGF